MPNLAPGAQAISVPADSSNIKGIQSLVDQVKQTTDHVDILFANAGATWGAPFDTHPDEAFAKVMDLNVKSVFGTIRLYVFALPTLPTKLTNPIDSPLSSKRMPRSMIPPA